MIITAAEFDFAAYQSGKWGDHLIIHGDCRDVLPKIPDKAIDLVLTDPPYGVGFKYDEYEDTSHGWKLLITRVMPDLKRIAGATILPSCQIKLLGWWYEHYPPDWVICWYKGSTGCAAYVGFNDWEPILVFGKLKGTCYHDYFRATPDSFTNGHPCPKPIRFSEYLISRASADTSTIIDPFLGSGTTLVAAKNLGRKAIGIEINYDYCKIAEQRLAQEVLAL